MEIFIMHTCISLRVKALPYIYIYIYHISISGQKFFFFPTHFSSSTIHIIKFTNEAVSGTHTHIHTPDVSGQVPCMRPNIFPQAFDTAAIFASTGKLWMTNETSLRCCFANVCAWPRMPKPVMSVAA